MQDKRIVSGPALRFEYFSDSIGIKPVRTESVYGLGRKRAGPAVPDDLPGPLDQICLQIPGIDLEDLRFFIRRTRRRHFPSIHPVSLSIR